MTLKELVRAQRLIEQYETLKSSGEWITPQMIYDEIFNEKHLNEKRYYQDGKPQRRISFDKIMETQPEEITIGEKTYPVLEYAQREFPVTTPLTPLVLGDEVGYPNTEMKKSQ